MIPVVDASAIGALLFGEADGAWVHHMTSGLTFIVPAMFHFELGNICWTKMRRHPGESTALLDAWLAWNAQPPVVVMAIDLAATMQLARDTGLTFYDASYLWLARDHAADVISLDAKLVRAARSLGVYAPSPGDPPTPHTTPRSRN
jgi:predicted nucleic acid-binding protein